MAYSTGSGSYTSMMAAVLAHAVADGWTEVGGVSSGWPIESPSSGGFFVDWSSDTFSEIDMTLGGTGALKTQRNIKLGMSYTSGAAATAAAATASNVTRNANYTITAWHIFSDPTISDHIMVCYEFSNDVDTRVFSHFGFGELDQEGLTHGGIGFTGGQAARGWAASGVSGISSLDWNSINRGVMAYAGAVGEEDDGSSRLGLMIRSTSHPIPSPGPGSGGWPNTNTLLADGAYVWKMSRMGADIDGSLEFNGISNPSLNANAWQFTPPPFSGTVTLMPAPIFIINGSLSSSVMFFAGSIPNFRLCSMEGYSPGDEVQFGSDTWVLFPLLCQKANSTLNTAYVVTSGQAGYAYKKVT